MKFANNRHDEIILYCLFYNITALKVLNQIELDDIRMTTL